MNCRDLGQTDCPRGVYHSAHAWAKRAAQRAKVWATPREGIPTMRPPEGSPALGKSGRQAAKERQRPDMERPAYEDPSYCPSPPLFPHLSMGPSWLLALPIHLLSGSLSPPCPEQGNVHASCPRCPPCPPDSCPWSSICLSEPIEDFSHRANQGQAENESANQPSRTLSALPCRELSREHRFPESVLRALAKAPGGGMQRQIWRSHPQRAQAEREERPADACLAVDLLWSGRGSRCCRKHTLALWGPPMCEVHGSYHISAVRAEKEGQRI